MLIDQNLTNSVNNQLHNEAIINNQHKVGNNTINENNNIIKQKKTYVKRVKNHKKEKQNEQNNENVKQYKDKQVKDCMTINLNSRENLYKNIVKLLSINTSHWIEADYLSTKNKREQFIEILEMEINNVKRKKFNFNKYKNSLYEIIGISQKKQSNESIIKNMYIAKLQNIIIIIKDMDKDENISEVQEEQTSSIHR